MKKMTYLLYLIGVIQIVLGLFYLFAPEFFLKSIGHSIPQADIFYTLSGIVNIADSAFPIFNGAWMMIILLLWMPKNTNKA
jgi:hypothetical protein